MSHITVFCRRRGVWQLLYSFVVVYTRIVCARTLFIKFFVYKADKNIFKQRVCVKTYVANQTLSHMFVYMFYILKYWSGDRVWCQEDPNGTREGCRILLYYVLAISIVLSQRKLSTLIIIEKFFFCKSTFYEYKMGLKSTVL